MATTFNKHINLIKEEFELNMPYKHFPEQVPYNLSHEHTRYSLGKWNKRYVSRINPIHLYEVNSINQLSAKPFYFVRDGLFLIVDFFNRFSNPKDLNCILIIHLNFKEFVPKKWRKSVLYYVHTHYPTIESHLFSIKEAGPEELIIKFDLLRGHDEEKLRNKLINKLTSSFSKIQLYPLFHGHNHFLDEQWKEDQHFNESLEYVGLLKKHLTKLKKSVTLATAESLNKSKNISKMAFLDLGFKGQYYSDDAINNHLLTNGAIPLSFEKIKTNLDSKNSFEIRLAHNYGIEIFSNEPNSDSLEKELKINFKHLGINVGEKLNVSAFQMIKEISNDFIHRGDIYLEK